MPMLYFIQPMSEKKGKRPEPTSKFVIKIVLICAMLLAIGGGVIVALLLTDPLKLGGPSLRKYNSLLCSFYYQTPF